MLRTLGMLWSRQVTKRPAPSGRPRFRPLIESLEGRDVPSATPLAAPLAPAQVAPMIPLAQQASTILPITVTSVNAVLDTATGAITSLVANVKLGNASSAIPLTISPNANSTAAVPILDLHLGEIHLNLLGLKVDTSEICLSIKAQPGPGNLLGNLLGGLANALNPTTAGGLGQTLTQALGGLTSTQLGTLTSGLTGLLNGALGQILSPAQAAGGTTSVTSSGNTQILHLAVGPLDVNLLGLQVHLDNCHNGPVTVDISAQTGPGKLLGNLLDSLSHILDGGAPVAGITHKLEKIAHQLLNLI